MHEIYSSDQLWPPEHSEKCLPVVPAAVRIASCSDWQFTRNYKRRQFIYCKKL